MSSQHSGAPVLDVRGLSIQFGGLKALQDLSFTIPAARAEGEPAILFDIEKE